MILRRFLECSSIPDVRKLRHVHYDMRLAVSKTELAKETGSDIYTIEDILDSIAQRFFNSVKCSICISS